MKIKEIFNHVPSIQEYLIEYGVSEPQKYLNPNSKLYEPFEDYLNYDRAYKCFMSHIYAKDNICLYVDVDQDGYASATIIYQLIQQLLPSKHIFPIFNDGKIHNLTNKIIDYSIQNECKLLIAPDGGSNDLDAHKTLHDNGIDCICLDHHTINENSEYAIVVNCQSDKVKNKYLSGGGVSYKFANYVMSKQKIHIEYKWIDLCAISIVADVMNLTSLENRMFVDMGLKHITNSFLQYIIDNVVKHDLIPKDISWSIAPLINSLIRQDNSDDKMRLFNAFVGNETDYKSVIAMCRKAHRQQNELVKELTENAMKDIDNSNKVIIAFSEPSNYTGLISNKISSNYLKPILLVHKEDKNYIGSLRSPIPLRNILNQSGIINWCNGHDCAAGISFPCDNLNELQKYLNSLNLSSQPEIVVLHSFQIDDIPQCLFDMVNGYKYIYGEGIPEPLIHIKPFKIYGYDIKAIGNGSTLKIQLPNLSFIKFFVGQSEKEKYPIGEDAEYMIEIVGTPSINEYNGNITNQVIINQMECNKVENKFDWNEIFS